MAKSARTKDREASESATLRAEHADLVTINAELRTKLRALQGEVVPMDEYRRVQALLRVTQIKLAQHTRQHVDATPGAKLSFRARFLRYANATGARSATPVELLAWEKENGHA